MKCQGHLVFVDGLGQKAMAWLAGPKLENWSRSIMPLFSIGTEFPEVPLYLPEAVLLGISKKHGLLPGKLGIGCDFSLAVSEICSKDDPSSGSYILLLYLKLSAGRLFHTWLVWGWGTCPRAGLSPGPRSLCPANGSHPGPGKLDCRECITICRGRTLAMAFHIPLFTVAWWIQYHHIWTVVPGGPVPAFLCCISA